MSSDGTTPVPDSAASFASFVRSMVAGVALINLFVFGMVAFSLYQSYGEFESHAEATVLSLSQMLAQDIGREFEKVDVTLLSAADEIERKVGTDRIDRSALSAFLGRLQGRIPEIINLRATDAAGLDTFGPRVDANARQDNSGREYFIRQRDNPNARLVVAKPEFANIDGRWAVPMSRSIHLPDGSFGGVVYADVALEHLTDVFSTFDVGRHGSVSVRDAELRIFARYPIPRDVDKVIGEKLAIPELQELIQAGRDAGTYTTNRTVDGVERKFGVRRIPKYPLYAVVGMAHDEYLVRWRDQVVKTSLLVALFSLATLMSSWLIYRNRRRQLAAAMELAREEEKFRVVGELGILALDGMDVAALDVQAATRVAAILDAKCCLVLELPPTRGALLLRASVGFDAGRCSEACLATGPGTLWGHTLASEEPTYLADLTNYGRFADALPLRELGVASGITLAIGSRENTLGALGVFTAERREFSRGEMQFLRSVAYVLAVAAQRKRAEEEIGRLASSDSLTGIANRRAFIAILERDIERSRRNGPTPSIIMCDLDDFKRVNDTFGHGVGDEVLRGVADLVKRNIRAGDVLARWGGEEFMVLIGEADIAVARSVAEKLRLAIAGNRFDQAGEVTASFGVTTFRSGEDMNAFLKRVDDALYVAKGKGRNRVETI